MRIDPYDTSICLADSVEPLPPGGAPTSTPVVLTSLFTFPTLDDLGDGLAREHETHVYTRGQNPTVEAAEHGCVQRVAQARWSTTRYAP